MDEKLRYKLARTIIKCGSMPFPITDTLYELFQMIITDEEAKFIVTVFNRKPNLNLDEIKEKIEMDEEELLKILKTLQYNGVISGTKSKTTGITVYRLQPPFPGLFEYQLMRPGEGEREKKLARLFDKVFSELGSQTARNYDVLMEQFKAFPTIDRVVPVEKEVDTQEEIILSREDVTSIIDKYDDIAVCLCYCRHEKDLLDDPCKLDAPRSNCFVFGKSAIFNIENDFAKPITKEEAKIVLSEAEDAGLVHKAFHVHSDPDRELEAICNCCNCCCGIFQLYNKGAMPFYTLTNYLAKVNEDDCIGCGTCEERCPMHAINLEDAIAVVDEKMCIGCGVCAHLCPEEAIHLQRSKEMRTVFIPPPKVTSE